MAPGMGLMGPVVGGVAFVLINVAIAALGIHFYRRRATQGKFIHLILSLQPIFMIFHIFEFQFIEEGDLLAIGLISKGRSALKVKKYIVLDYTTMLIIFA